MSNTMIFLKGTLKVIKYFFLAVVFIVFGLAYIYQDEKERQSSKEVKA